MTFSSQLRALRLKAKLTQEQLARKADVTGATVAKLETDDEQDPKWTTVCKLADALGISVQEFREPQEVTLQLNKRGRPRKAKKGGAR
jgi:transcriptional regulator with XRE-family HTH domain